MAASGSAGSSDDAACRKPGPDAQAGAEAEEAEMLSFAGRLYVDKATDQKYWVTDILTQETWPG